MNLIELAIENKKPSKMEAQKIIKSLAALHPENIGDLEKLYSFFMPAPSKKPKTPFQWVARAVGKKDLKEYLNYVYATETEIVATDGHRMHITRNTDSRFKPGYYLANGELAYPPDQWTYPNYRRILQIIGGSYQHLPASTSLLIQMKLVRKGACFYIRITTRLGDEELNDE